jgi:hypothetical protein
LGGVARPLAGQHPAEGLAGVHPASGLLNGRNQEQAGDAGEGEIGDDRGGRLPWRAVRSRMGRMTVATLCSRPRCRGKADVVGNPGFGGRADGC